MSATTKGNAGGRAATGAAPVGGSGSPAGGVNEHKHGRAEEASGAAEVPAAKKVELASEDVVFLGVACHKPSSSTESLTGILHKKDGGPILGTRTPCLLAVCNTEQAILVGNSAHLAPGHLEYMAAKGDLLYKAVQLKAGSLVAIDKSEVGDSLVVDHFGVHTKYFSVAASAGVAEELGDLQAFPVVDPDLRDVMVPSVEHLEANERFVLKGGWALIMVVRGAPVEASQTQPMKVPVWVIMTKGKDAERVTDLLKVKEAEVESKYAAIPADIAFFNPQPWEQRLMPLFRQAFHEEEVVLGLWAGGMQVRRFKNASGQEMKARNVYLAQQGAVARVARTSMLYEALATKWRIFRMRGEAAGGARAAVAVGGVPAGGYVPGAKLGAGEWEVESASVVWPAAGAAPFVAPVCAVVGCGGLVVPGEGEQAAEGKGECGKCHSGGLLARPVVVLDLEARQAGEVASGRVLLASAAVAKQLGLERLKLTVESFYASTDGEHKRAGLAFARGLFGRVVVLSVCGTEQVVLVDAK